MPNSGGLKPLWLRLYEQAAVETDREKLTEERNAIAQASENLLIIKTEKLKWPPIEMK
jgi:hypothetical protein